MPQEHEWGWKRISYLDLRLHGQGENKKKKTGGAITGTAPGTRNRRRCERHEGGLGSFKEERRVEYPKELGLALTT